MPRHIYLKLHLLVALLAMTAILGRLITLSATGLVAWRTLLAAVGAAVLVGVVLRRRLWLPWRQGVALLGIGVIIGVHWMCFFGAVKLANISICLAGMATIAFFTAFTEPLLERRRVRPLEVWLGLLVVLGIVLVAGFERGRLLGLGVALLGSLLAAVFPVLNRYMVRQERMAPLVMVAWEMAGACAICLACLRWLDGPGAYAALLQLRGWDGLWLLLLGWVCTVFAHGYHIHLLRHLSAYTGNLAMNCEPIYGMLAAALVFGEHRELHPGFYAGTAAILGANLLHPWILGHLARQRPKT
ncbi:MAG: EamA family transporter [Verrucomicrobia bacterium]|nr:EamA family transporter [Verrucomicrobiota bacterium]